MEEQAAQSAQAPVDEMKAVIKRNMGSVSDFGEVTVGLFFSPTVMQFSPRAMRFLREFGPDISMDEAAKKSGVPVEYAKKLLKQSKVKEFLADKFQQIAVQRGWTVERWFTEGDAVWRGKKFVTREQMDIWKEFGARILPKARTGGTGDGAEKNQIIINVGAGAVDEAFIRQKAIEAEVLDARAQGTI